MSKTREAYDIHHEITEVEVDKLRWRPGAYGLIFNDKDEILLVLNRNNNRYEFPGGGVEIHETFEEALLREVWEETGVTVSIDSFVMFTDGFFLSTVGNHWHTIKGFYRCHVIEGELRATILDGEPLEKPVWVAVDSLTQDDLTIGWDALELARKK